LDLPRSSRPIHNVISGFVVIFDISCQEVLVFFGISPDCENLVFIKKYFETVDLKYFILKIQSIYEIK